jgi:hypothetical protein
MMKVKDYIKKIGIAVLALVLLAALVVPLVSHSVKATPPSAREELPEYELGPTQIYPENATVEEDLMEITVEDLSEATGEELGECICRILVFRVTQAAILQLYPESDLPPIQGEIKVTYHNPSEGHKNAFDYLLTPECCQLEMPEGTTLKHLTMENFKYEFNSTYTGVTFETQVKEDIFPEGFLELRGKVKSGEANSTEKAKFAEQWSDVRDKFLTMETYELFTGIEKPEEEEEEEAGGFPAGAVLFGVLIAGVVTYTVRARR